MRRLSRSRLVEQTGWTGGTYVEVATPYDETELATLKYAQSADVLYLASPTHPPAKLTRTDHDQWYYQAIDFEDGPYLDENDDTTALLTLTTASTWTKGSTLTLTATGVQNAPFQAEHVGALWRLRVGTETAWVSVTAYTSPTVVTVQAKKDVPAALQAVATSLWQEGAWSQVRGYPKVVTIFEQRLIWGSSDFQPQTLWGSVSDDYENMTAGTTADDALIYTIGSNQVNVHRWLVGVNVLAIGTVGNEFIMEGGVEVGLTPTSVRARRQASNGSNLVAPVEVDGDILFIQRSGKKLRRFAYALAQDRYATPDLTLLSEHILGPGAQDMTYEREPSQVIWIPRSDGVLASLTYWPDQDVVAWARHTTGASGRFEYMATIPSPDGTRHQTWAVVRRTINGQSTRYIELLDPDRKTDCSLTYNGPATSSFSGLSHLDGQTVAVLGDGSPRDSQTVVNGTVSISGPPVTTGEVGLPFTSTLKLLRPMLKDARGFVYARPERWGQVWLAVHNCQGLTVNGDFIPAFEAGDDFGEATTPFTGIKKVVTLGWDDAGQLTIQQTQPVSWRLLGVFGRLEVGA